MVGVLALGFLLSVGTAGTWHDTSEQFTKLVGLVFKGAPQIRPPTLRAVQRVGVTIANISSFMFFSCFLVVDFVLSIICVNRHAIMTHF